MATDEEAQEEVKQEETQAAAQEASQTMITLILPVEFQTNGVKYGPGKVTLPENEAEDLARRVDEYNTIEHFRVTPGDYRLKEAAGGFSAKGK